VKPRRLVAVVGGGPAGLAAAYRLSEDPNCEVLLLERAPRLGGLAAGMQRDGMRLDFGPHRLHAAADPEVLADLRGLLGDELETRTRRGLIHLNGKYLPFPPNARTLVGLGPVTLVRATLGMLLARGDRRPPATYADAVTRAVGRPLYRLFYGPYARKVWGLPGEAIAVEQAARRVNQRGFGDFLRLILTGGASKTFLYPRGGFGRIPEVYAQALARRPNVHLSCASEIGAVQMVGDRIQRLEYEHEGRPTAVEPEQVVWTAPLRDLAALANVCPPAAQAAAASLRMRAVVIAYAQVARPSIGSADTYYYPEARFPFNRVMEQKRFSAELVAADRTVLVMDLACDPQDERFTASDDGLLGEIGPALEAANLVRRSEITAFWSVRFRSAYPIYGLETAGELAVAHAWADGIVNLWLAGRQGLFLHNNTHHSLLMGYRAAAAIRGGVERDRWLQEVATFADFTVAD
jgi:protoporphyrinogen oxidase